MEEKKVPALRFRGFDNAWEQRRLGEVCSSFDYGMNVAAKEFDGENKYIRITDIDDASREFLLRDISSPDICLEREEVSKYLLSNGDIVFARTGASVGKTYIYKKKDGVVYFAGFLIRVKVNKENDADFIFQNTLSVNYNRYITITSQRSGQPGVNAQEYSEYSIFIPLREEQKKIGNYLCNFDHLISLHQRKLEMLKKIKKSMLEKMFPKNDAKVPELRFSDFTDAWEQKELGELFSYLQNNTLSRAELNDNYGVAQSIHYGDVLIKYGECLDVSKERLAFIEKQSIADKFKTAYLQDGDIIVADTAEDGTVGKCTEIQDLTDKKIISGLHTIPLRPDQKFASGYLGFYMNSNSYHDQLKPLMQGIKVTSISKSAIQNTVVRYPFSLKEQGLVSRYLCLLNTLISLHQRKLEKLKNIKKSMLEKMFII